MRIRRKIQNIKRARYPGVRIFLAVLAAQVAFELLRPFI